MADHTHAQVDARPDASMDRLQWAVAVFMLAVGIAITLLR